MDERCYQSSIGPRKLDKVALRQFVEFILIDVKNLGNILCK